MSASVRFPPMFYRQFVSQCSSDQGAVHAYCHSSVAFQLILVD